jgi:hypothetical protein
VRSSLLVAVVLSAALTGCTADSSATTSPSADSDALVVGGPSAGASPSAEPEPSLVEVAPSLPPRPTGPSCAGGRRTSPLDEPDYSDFLRFGGRTYFLSLERAQVRLGREVGVVRCRLDGSGTPRSYEPRDGDAAYEAAGTRLYRVVGRPLREALAVRDPDGITLYEVER